MWILAVATVIYAVGVARLWRAAGRGRGISRRRVLLYAGGTITIAIALLPLDTLADDTFAGHMTQHLLLICVAAPLLVLGNPIIAALWALPRSWRAKLGHGIGAVLATLGRPSLALSLSVVTLAFWHVPRAYAWATANEGVHVVEHTTFLLTACIFWWAVLPGANGRRLGYGTGAFSICAMAMVMGIYGAVLTFAHIPLYGAYRLADQQLAGVIMWIPTGVIYLGAALWCVFEWMSVDGPTDRASERLLSSTS